MWTKEKAIEYAKKELAKYGRAKGGMWVDGGGYIQFRFEKNGKSCRFHRFITEKRLARKLETALHVHHDDEDKLNNTPGNLKVTPIGDHNRLHPNYARSAMDKRLLWRETRKGEGNPNYGNHKSRKSKPREEVERMRRNQPNYVHVDKDDLIESINKYRQSSIVCRHLNISFKVFMNRCKQYGLEYKSADDGLIPII